MLQNFIFTVLLSIFSFSLSAYAQAPEHFYNPPENLNPDPDYTPGDYAFPDPFVAKTIYEGKKLELSETYPVESSKNKYLLGAGEISFSSLKNETIPVKGYFRNYSGALKIGINGPETMKILIDVNSMDTGVPGRNNRILEIFFQSMNADLGTISVEFNEFDLGEKTWENLKDGKIHSVKASGTVLLNLVEQAVNVVLNVRNQNGTWVVETSEPFIISLSDFNFGIRPYELMKVCNHKALGNNVEVEASVYLR